MSSNPEEKNPMTFERSAGRLADALRPVSIPVSYTHLTLPTSDLV